MIGGVRRLRSLQIDSSSVAVDHAINSATGPTLTSWTGWAGAAKKVTANSPELKTLRRGNLLAPQLAIIATGCHHLVSVDLSSAGEDDGRLTDDAAVKVLIDHCPSIEQLSLFNTSVTIDTVRALKTYRPLTLLTLGGDRELRLFATEDAETALGDLLSARGAPLTRLRIGERGWCMRAELALLLPDAVPRLRSLHLLGGYSTRVIGWFVQRLPALHHLGVGYSVELEQLKEGVPRPVAALNSRDLDRLFVVGKGWDRLAGASPP
ncbi:hypothetical protein BDK51DRAFT_43925 [Blyttiomyces helicus]|uniref:F-box domain-containing protein n=1 Tax=Blyttiomyces helicus TaxID=388810 RepID=A0A4P9WBF9_9FUNG|nr:hypothetical protein BDK51DRAFT_43925 [Blyttiomyces helicus]|eukprot:RKO89961.1 hypothetical protein BDK51DRAFT_43925 [Blyttiomyces helicus]